MPITSSTSPASGPPAAESHPLPFFLPPGARLLMLGSFPPKANRWSMPFFYPNLQNDMWRIMGLLFFGDKDHLLTPDKKAFDKARIQAFCTEKGIALGDTASEVIRLRDNASDQFLEVVGTIDLADTLERLPHLQALVTTGQKATDTLLTLINAPEPPIGASSAFRYEGRELELFRMPSSSRAYPKPLSEKAAVYRGMFEKLGML